VGIKVNPNHIVIPVLGEGGLRKLRRNYKRFLKRRGLKDENENVKWRKEKRCRKNT